MTVHEQSSDLAAVVAALESRLETQERSLAGMRTKLESAHASRRSTRLRVLVPITSLICVMVLSLALLPTARAQKPTEQPSTTIEAAREQQARESQPAPAAGVPAEKQVASPSATGGNMLIGSGNAPSAATDYTRLYNPSSSELMSSTLQIDNYTNSSLINSGGILTGRRVAIVGSTSGSDTGVGSHIGVLGASDTWEGVHGYSPGTAGTGVRGNATSAVNGWGVWGSGGRYGGVFEGEGAAIRLVPSSMAGPPTTGFHSLGELVVSDDGHLWFCRESGTPGTWVRLDLSATFVPLVQK